MCTECPLWSLKLTAGRKFCEWCQPGEQPNSARDACVSPQKGADSNAGRTDWTNSWRRDSKERQDAFCPNGQVDDNDCMYGPAAVSSAVCPMTCPRNYQVEVDDKWNPEGFFSSQQMSNFFGFNTLFDVGWKCLIQDQ